MVVVNKLTRVQNYTIIEFITNGFTISERAYDLTEDTTIDKITEAYAKIKPHIDIELDRLGVIPNHEFEQISDEMISAYFEDLRTAQVRASENSSVVDELVEPLLIVEPPNLEEPSQVKSTEEYVAELVPKITEAFNESIKDKLELLDNILSEGSTNQEIINQFKIQLDILGLKIQEFELVLADLVQTELGRSK